MNIIYQSIRNLIILFLVLSVMVSCQEKDDAVNEDVVFEPTDIFFVSGKTGDDGTELYISDGTASGTELFNVFQVSNSDSYVPPIEGTKSGDTYYFSADDGVHGFELWASNIDSKDLRLVKDINPDGNSNPGQFTTIGDTFYFVASDGSNGRQLWKIVGNTDVIISVFIPASHSDDIFGFFALNEKLYFTLSNTSTGKKEIWSSDGSEAGTVFLKACDYTSILIGINDELLYSCSEIVKGLSLWKTVESGTSTEIIVNIPVRDNNNFTSLAGLLNNIVYFSVFNSENGFSLWKSDGTVDGTVKIKDMPENFFIMQGVDTSVVLNNILFFIGNDSLNGNNVWKTDGTEEGTEILTRDLTHSVRRAYGWQVTVVNTQLLFWGIGSNQGVELWKSDGTEAGTTLLKDINPGSGSSIVSSPSYTNLTSFFATDNKTVIFTADDGTHGAELWRTDGTEKGTKMIADLNPGPEQGVYQIIAP